MKKEKQKKKEKKKISLQRVFTQNMLLVFCGTFLIFSILLGIQVFKGIREEKELQNSMYVEMLSNQIV